MASEPRQPKDYIEPLNINGMSGRMLHLPAPKKYQNREFLFVYGQHSSLERLWGLMEVLNRYGAVTMPDLPGFGGMDSMYSIGSKPTLDNLADYLATFVRWRFKRRRVVIVGLSFGFLVATRMLQRYPDLTKKVDLVVSIVGFAHRDDFSFSRKRFLLYKYGSAFFARRLSAWVFQHVFLQPAWLRLVYSHSYNARSKFDGKSGAEFKATMDMEINLWKINDIRTQMQCNGEMFRLDNCRSRIDLPFYHISVDADQYFDNNRVEQHLRVVFGNYHGLKANLPTHSISVIADKKAAEPMVPSALKRVLREATG